MRKRVLVIHGGPRRGATWRLVRRLEERIDALEGPEPVEFDYLHLAECDLRSCRGCFTCFVRGEEHCPLDDERAAIEERMLAADGVVFATPNYAGGMASGMKTLLERTAFRMHRPRYFDQFTVFVVTSGGPAGIGGTLKGLESFTAMGFRKVAVLARPVIHPAVRSLLETERDRRRTTAAVEKAAKRFHRALVEKPRRRIGLGDLIHFAAMKGTLEYGRSYFAADYRHYRDRGWLEPGVDYFVPGRLGPLKRLLGRLFQRMIRRFTRRAVLENGHDPTEIRRLEPGEYPSTCEKAHGDK